MPCKHCEELERGNITVEEWEQLAPIGISLYYHKLQENNDCYPSCSECYLADKFVPNIKRLLVKRRL